MADIVKVMQAKRHFHALKGASAEDIRRAEEILGVRFAKDYCQYVAAFGAASLSGHELTGVCNAKRLSVVNVTIEERHNTAVPKDWYVLEQANIDNIVLWQASNGCVYQTMPNAKAIKISNSLIEYIMKW